ncbi:hypothetical protein [Pseudobutyrivibrio ruminis]|uniref:Uncharacterized protein n=1 Tax=Pseudobutyrivibrio ruminis DSM 9787 TaxID=1123011 RepID=A0A285TD99_9FIRM|nr:hypothetical protein [Pseudobutyrivibrio ruminis]SOC17729.1 hypothetical protein SAMN02910411_0506 [Pseudobutyrivibrio ruminis DSM 9787]
MSYYLSDTEAKVSRTITNIVKELPDTVEDFAKYMEFENHKKLSYIYECIRNIRLFYQVLASELGIDDIKAIGLVHLSNLTPEILDKYVSSPSKPKRMYAQPVSPNSTIRSSRKTSLWFYYDYLVYKRLVENNPVFDWKKINKPKKSKRISSPDKVRFTGDAKMKTTIDGKYSIIKERNPNREESMFVYHIRDEEKSSYFTDENGEILSIIPYKEAREFVKNLYAKDKK